jgi:putative ABC transport system permease protein
LGTVLAYLLLAIAQPVLINRFGIFVRISMLRSNDVVILAAIVIAALGIGAIPAWRAYRHSLADGLTIRV